MTAVAEIRSDIQTARENLRQLLASILLVDDGDQLQDAMNRVKLAREWAKIQKVAAEMQADLLRVETACLRRMGQIDAMSGLSPQVKAAAKYFAALTDAAFDALVKRYSDKGTALALYRQMNRDEQFEEGRERGRRFGTGRETEPGTSYAEADVERLIKYECGDIRGALAVLMADYGNRNVPFSVSDVVEELIEDAGIPYGAADEGFREGLSEVVRSAIRSSPVLEVDGTKCPRFVTCMDDGGFFRRIPFENATARQFDQMIRLREEQIAQDEAALDRLRQVRLALGPFAPEGVTLGMAAVQCAAQDHSRMAS